MENQTEKTYNYKFLNLLEKELDPAQMKALSTTKNAVIAAGAGSGKTQVLATRFAWLVMTGQAKSDQILTLTFTNKAASEMYQRIYSTLNFFANCETGENLTPQEKKLAQQGVQDFANAHVQTLDSYCSNIVRQCANRYAIRPDFSLASGDGLHEIKEKALKFIFTHADEKGIKTFVQAGKFQEFAEKTLAYSINNFTDLTAPKDFFSSKLPVQIKYITQTLNFYFDENPLSEENYPCEHNFQKLIDDFFTELNANFDPKKHIAYRTKAEDVFDFYTRNLSGFSFSDDKIAENTFFQKFQSDFEKFNTMLCELSSMSGKCTSANKIITVMKGKVPPVIDSIIAYFNQIDAIKSMYSLLDEFLEEVNSSKRSSGNLSFNDISSLALKILVENEDIRNQEIQAYKKIMIDEFQDNNGKNRDLLYLLSVKENTPISSEKNIYSQIIIKDEFAKIIKDNREQGKLFFVGDEKQSIYKFRGADVSVFNELTQSGENILIPMTFNYRSLPQTIQAFNQIFKNGCGIFEENSNQKDYEAYYNKDALKKGIDLPELTAENVPIHFKFINTKKLSDKNSQIKNPSEKLIHPDEQIGYAIASKIYEMTKSLDENNKNWKDFAILDKSRTHRSEITKYLGLFNIPYELDQFSNIFEDGIINDFYNFLRICVYPSDINAYTSYLCSPLCGIDENSVEIIFSHLSNQNPRDFDFVFNPFCNEETDEKIRKDLQTLSLEDDFEKYLNAKEFFSETRSLVLQQRITKTVDMLWNKKGYKYETVLNKQTELCAEQFDMIFELARQAEENEKSVSWFIDELEILKENFSTEDSDIDAKNISYPLERPSAVKIMTIHKSKGLEFKHVFLCGCTGVSSKSEKNTVFFDEKTGLSIRPEKGVKNFFVQFEENLSKKKELAEFRRLIYVGITRAIEDVFVMGKWNGEDSEKDENSFSSKAKMFEHLSQNVYSSNEEGKTVYTPGACFDFEELSPVSYEQTKSAEKKWNVDFMRQKLIENADSFYKNAKIISYNCNPIIELEPSKLETLKKSQGIKDFQIKTTQNSNNQIQNENQDKNQDENTLNSLDEDQLIYQKNLQNEEKNIQDVNFTTADFGILAHAYLEAYVNGISPQFFEPEPSYFKNLGEKEIREKKEICSKYVENFAESEIGKNLEKAKKAGFFVRSEWKIKMFYKGAIFTGVLDLIFETEGEKYTIVDYKHYEKLDVKKFYSQLNCYRMMASKVLNIPETSIDCKIWDIKQNMFFDVPISQEQDVRQ